MKRHISLQQEFIKASNLFFSDEEALLLQLLRYLYESGFLYDDASASELDEGGSVIEQFFAQEGQVMEYLVDATRYHKFFSYAKERDPSKVRGLLHEKILRSFYLIVWGDHQQLRLQRSVQLGLQNLQQGPLQDFLVYIKVYYNLLLNLPEGSEEVDAASSQKFSVDDILKLRQQALNHIENSQKSKFVSKLLGDIQKQGQVSLPQDLKHRADQARRTITFIRPSQQHR